jgi:hypothetical protein
VATVTAWVSGHRRELRGSFPDRISLHRARELRGLSPMTQLQVSGTFGRKGFPNQPSKASAEWRGTAGLRSGRWGSRDIALRSGNTGLPVCGKRDSGGRLGVSPLRGGCGTAAIAATTLGRSNRGLLGLGSFGLAAMVQRFAKTTCPMLRGRGRPRDRGKGANDREHQQ